VPLEFTPPTRTSSNIKGAHHDAATGTMTVQFHSGATWEYYEVPVEHHGGMLADDSPGGYFHKNIKSQFKGKRVDG
jgi:hypothetical protein